MMSAQAVNWRPRNYSRADCPDSFNVELRRNTSKLGFEVLPSGEKVGTLHDYFTTLSPLRSSCTAAVVNYW
jgi:hypothetical protein